MYMYTDCIPTAHITASAAGVSYDPSDCRLARFPVIRSSNPTWVLSTIPIIASDISQDPNPNSRTTCISAMYYKSDTRLAAPSCLRSFPNQRHSALSLTMFRYTAGQSLAVCSRVLLIYWNRFTPFTNRLSSRLYKLNPISLVL